VAAAPAPTPPDVSVSVDSVDTSYLETLIGYNARRAALSIIGLFLERMEPYGVRIVDFSVLSLIHHNPGITSRQLCASLGLLPPNLVSMLQQLEQRQVLERRPHPTDGRAVSLHLTPQGHAMMLEAEATAYQLEVDATANLTDAQRSTLRRLLREVYASPPKGDKGGKTGKTQAAAAVASPPARSNDKSAT
jgi:DNA-binding MarR family transcriptional regulator